jgi:CubicO group peptidase (beta-lactamase class C family)
MLRWLIAAGVLYGGFVALLYVAQRSLQYFPERRRTSPSAVDLAEAEETVLNTSDGERVIVWHVPPRGPRTVAFMTSDHLWPGIAFSPVTLELFEPLGFAPTPKVGQGFGLGFVVRTQEGRNPMPGSPGEYSWAGIWGTTFWVDPKEQLVAVMMMQAAPLQARYYRSLIRNLVSQALID